MGLFNPNRSLDFMTEWYLFREDCWRNQRRRSGLRRDGFVDKIPEEVPLCHEKDKKDDDLCAFRSNDRFGFKGRGWVFDRYGRGSKTRKTKTY